jgi:hypothetical protein
MFSKIPNWLLILSAIALVGGGTAFILVRRKKRLAAASAATAAAGSAVAQATLGNASKIFALGALSTTAPIVQATAQTDGTVTIQTAAGNAIIGNTVDAPPVAQAVALANDGVVIGAVNDPATNSIATGVVGSHTLPNSAIVAASGSGISAVNTNMY